MRLLIIEDESLLADRLAATCRERGYVVDVAADGEHGDFLVSTEAYDAVVLDLGLSLVDGLTLLERWRAGGIAVRGTRQPDEGEGADDPIGRPIVDFHVGSTQRLPGYTT